MSLCGDWLWRGQACSADSPEDAKETSPTPALHQRTRHLPLVQLQSSVRLSISPHAQLSSLPRLLVLLPPVLLSLPSG